jgi:photosystem II stability/assembly factor-like uncharacterized protein
VAKRIALVAVLALMAVGVAHGGDSGYAWKLTPTGSEARLRGVSSVDATTVWTSGSLGTVLRSTDGGATWQSVGPPHTEELQFRDIEAFDALNAVVLSIGPSGDSRVYVTADGGGTWTLGFQNDDPNAFYDCMTFFDRHRGLALSDPVDGKFRIIATADGGRSWSVVTTDMPPALAGEFAFAASGQCLVSEGGRAWFATGGAEQAQVFRSDDGGTTWNVFATPIKSGATAGIFALAFRDAHVGLAVGGDFAVPSHAPDALALTKDGGESWRLADDPPGEYRSGAAWVTGSAAVVVGPTGSDVSLDRGRTWQRFDSGSFDTVDCNHGACWASGEQGRVAFLVRQH